MGSYAGTTAFHPNRCTYESVSFHLSGAEHRHPLREILLALFLQAILGLVIYDFLAAFWGFERVCSIVKSWKVHEKCTDPNVLQNICRAIDYACTLYPRHARCLQRSFATTWMLRRHGITAYMALGARKMPFKAHAWVEVNGYPVNERSDVQGIYQVWERC